MPHYTATQIAAIVIGAIVGVIAAGCVIWPCVAMRLMECRAKKADEEAQRRVTPPPTPQGWGRKMFASSPSSSTIESSSQPPQLSTAGVHSLSSQSMEVSLSSPTHYSHITEPQLPPKVKVRLVEPSTPNRSPQAATYGYTAYSPPSAMPSRAARTHTPTYKARSDTEPCLSGSLEPDRMPETPHLTKNLTREPTRALGGLNRGVG